MTESSSVSPPSTLTLADVAEVVDGVAKGDPALPVRGVGPLDTAGPGDIAPLTAKRYTKYVAGSHAGAILVSEDLEAYVDGRSRVVVKDPKRALMKLLTRLHPPAREPAGVHPTVVLGKGVRLGDDVGIGPYAVLGDGVEIGDGSRIGAHVVLGRGVRVGRSCTIHPQVVIYPHAVLSDRVILHSGVCLGSDGFGYTFFDGAHQRMPHVGTVVIGSDVEIGANSAVDRGSIGDTVIEQGVKIDNLVHIAHNVRIGELSMIAGMAGIAGSTRIGKGVWMGGQAGVVNHVEVGDGARIAVATKVMRDVPAGETMSGHPARPHREDLNRQAQLGRLEKLVRRLKALETEVAALKTGAGT